MEITVLFFGELAEIAGTKAISVEDIEDTVYLKEYISKQYPKLKNRTYRMAVNKELVNEKQLLHHGDEIALLPAFAGG
jgi:molybdopterin converting factor subunit 1